MRLRDVQPWGARGSATDEQRAAAFGSRASLLGRSCSRGRRRRAGTVSGNRSVEELETGFELRLLLHRVCRIRSFVLGDHVDDCLGSRFGLSRSRHGELRSLEGYASCNVDERVGLGRAKVSNHFAHCPYPLIGYITILQCRLPNQLAGS